MRILLILHANVAARFSGSILDPALMITESSGTLTIEEGTEGINNGETVKVELNGVK